MPQLRTFSGFASTPNTGSATVGAAGVAQRAQEAGMQAANERARISQQMAIAQMENQARQQALQMQMLKEQQELAVQKAYQESVLGLKDRDLQLQEKVAADEIAQAAALSSNRMAMQQEVQRLMSPDGGGMKPQEAFRQAVMTHGASAQLPGSAYSDVIDSQKADMIPDMNLGDMKEVPNSGGYRYGRTGPNSVQFFPPEKSAPIPKDLPFDPSKVQYGTRVFDKPAATEANKLEKQINELKKHMASKEYAAVRQSVMKANNPEAKLSIGDKGRIKEHEERMAELRDLQKQVADLRSSFTNSPSSGRTKRVGNFEIILDD